MRRRGLSRLGLIAAVLPWALGAAVVPAWATACQDYEGGLRWMAGLELGESSYSDVALQGDYAYVALGRLRIVDVAIPTEPAFVGTVGNPGPISVDAAGDRLVTALGAAGIDVYSLPTPGQPQFQLRYQTPEYVEDVALAGQFCYLACQDIGLLVLDLSDPLNPQSLGSVGTGSCRRVHHQDGYLYTVMSNAGVARLIVYELADPGLPAETFRWGSQVLDAVPNGDRLYIARGAAGIALFDLADPAVPALLGSQDTPEHATTASGFADYFLVLESSGSRITCYDVAGSPPWNPVAACATAFSPDVIALRGDHAFVPSSEDFEVFAVNPPEGGAAPLGYLEDLVSNAMLHVAAGDRYAYVSNIDGQTGNGLVQVIDIQDPSAPQSILAIDYGYSFVQDLALGPNLLFVVDGLGVDILDVAMPNQAKRIGRVDTPGISQQACVAGGHLLVADAEAGLQVISYADPALPIIVGNLDFSQGAYAVAGVDQYALVLLAGGVLKVVDFENISAPVEVGTLSGFWGSHRIAVEGHHAYIDGEAEIYVVDLAVPSAPSLVGGAALAGAAFDLVVNGDALYVASYTAGLQVLDVADPAHPRLLGDLPLAGFSEGIATNGDLICVASTARLNFAPLHCPNLTPVDDETPPATKLVLSAQPNPFNPTTRLRFTLPAPDRVSLAVYDAAGRHVRTLLAASTQPAGDTTLDWDGRSDAGDPLPSGVYLLRLVAGDQSAATKLTVLR